MATAPMKTKRPAPLPAPRVRGLFSPQDRRNPKVRVFLGLTTLFLFIGALVTVAPILWMVLGSFRTPEELYAVPPTYLPQDPQFDNYVQAFHLVPLFRYLLNSLLICGAVVAGQILFCSMAAYSISKLRVKFSGAILLLFMTSLMVPFEVLIIPLYLITKSFPLGPGFPGVNLLNSYWAIILPSVFSAFGILLLKDFYDSIPNEILYAARIDGCGELRVFFRFILPMTRPIMAILAVFSFVTTWNSFFWPLVVLNNPDFYPLVLGVQKLIDMGEPWNIVLAALVLSAMPSVLLLILFQKTIIRGIAYTGVYG
ncbi:MAG TPA: carbohydrate ABC transporter permease [bacterium]|nr:carbohydrate ABC transporter permease [bacterium]